MLRQGLMIRARHIGGRAAARLKDTLCFGKFAARNRAGHSAASEAPHETRSNLHALRPTAAARRLVTGHPFFDPARARKPLFSAGVGRCAETLKLHHERQREDRDRDR